MAEEPVPLDSQSLESPISVRKNVHNHVFPILTNQLGFFLKAWVVFHDKFPLALMYEIPSIGNVEKSHYLLYGVSSPDLTLLKS